jgi:hypothetical protein
VSIKNTAEALKRMERLGNWIRDEGDILPYPPGENYDDDLHWFDFLYSLAHEALRNRKAP